MADLACRNLKLIKNDRTLVKDASTSLTPGELTVLIGPNGAGKSSLLRMLAGLEEPSNGEVLLRGTSISMHASSERARWLAYLPQKRPLAWPVSVHDVVALGRYAHGASPSRLTGADRDAVNTAIEACSLRPFTDRSVDSLSGGEEARVHCARLLATEAPVILADEPAASLDPFHQHQVMTLFRRFADSGGSALIVLHDLTLALQYADRVMIMKDGAITYQGVPQDVLTSEILQSAYGVPMRVTDETVISLRP